MAHAGQLAGAVDATQRGLAAHLRLSGPPLPFGPFFHLMLRADALMVAGHLSEAAALAQEQYDRAIEEGSVEAQGWFADKLAQVALREGRVDTAARLAGEAAATFRELGWRLFVRCALSERAHALALLGAVGTARAVLAELDALGVTPGELRGPEVLRARAWTAVAGGDAARGRKHLREAVRMAQAGGGAGFECAALHDLARLGRAGEVSERLQELTGLVEGPLVSARAAHATALAAREPRGLEEACSRFEDLGAVLLAAEAAADAAAAWRRHGVPRRATWAERRSSALAGRCEGARSPSLATAADARAALTPRELEIARLAATGLTNKEIAARLHLSHRTVENRLYTTYQKLGIDGRGALGPALEAH